MATFKKWVDVTPQTAEVLARIKDAEVRRALLRLTAQAADVLDGVQALDIPARELPRSVLDEHERTAAAWPLARACAEAVDPLLATVRECFPEPAQEAEPDLDAAFSGGDAPAAAGAPADPGAAVRAIVWGIEHELDRVRPALEGAAPSAPEESWRALLSLQELRGKLRNGVCELIYEAYRVHAPVTREEVIPGYRERLTSALELRRAIARLRHEVLPLCERVKQASRSDLGPSVDALAAAIERFCTSHAYAALRLTDRKLAARFRKRLAHLRQSPAPAPGRNLAEDLARFAEGLTAISRREMLVLHDTEALRACRKNASEAMAQGRPAELADGLFALALGGARELGGVDPELDQFLDEATSWDGGRPPGGAAAAAERLLALVEKVGPAAA